MASFHPWDAVMHWGGVESGGACLRQKNGVGNHTMLYCLFACHPSADVTLLIRQLLTTRQGVE